MTALSIGLPYYRNSGMLAEQYRVWAAYPSELKAQIEILVMEDAEHTAVSVPRPEGLPPFRLLRLLPTEKLATPPWRQHACRNRMAEQAVADWLLLTDMDHVLPAESLARLLARLETSEPKSVYRFRRVDAPDLKPTIDAAGRPKLHVNTFAIRKTLFWQLGGYDEECVGYGTDGYFRRRLQSQVKFTDLKDINIIRYSREVMPDASTRPDKPMDPRAFRNACRRNVETQRALARKRATKAPPTVLTIPWEQVL